MNGDDHDIVVWPGVREILILCRTCDDEIGGSFLPLTLEDVTRCVDMHLGRTELVHSHNPRNN